jgi:DNA-binding LacI/PurR family transcriptional regulator
VAQAPTSRDVARRAGVAQSTVSYVLSGNPVISQATRDRVMQAIDELGYQPNSGARALKRRRSQVIGLVFPIRPTREVAGEMHFIALVADACRRHGYDALIVTADEGAAGLRRVAATALADGLLVMGVAEPDPRTEVVGTLSIPAVLVGLPQDHNGTACVDQDYEAAARGCVDALADAGHRHAFFLLQPEGDRHWRGYVPRFTRATRARARERDLALTEVTSDMSFSSHRDAMARLVRERGEHDALIIGPPMDIELTAAMMADADLNPGRDISVIAPSSQVGSITDPKWDITSFDTRVEAVVDLAIERLTAMIEGTTPSGATVELISPVFHAGATLLPLPPGAPPPP